MANIPDTKRKYLVKYNKKYGKGSLHLDSLDSLEELVKKVLNFSIGSGKLRFYKSICSIKQGEVMIFVPMNKHILTIYRLNMKKHRR